MAKVPAKYDPEKNSKTAIIMTYFESHPDASNVEAAETLNGYGVEVTPNYIATIKSQQKKKAGGTMRRKKSTKKATKRTVQATSEATPLDTALDLVKQSGSVEAARKTLDQLEQIAKVMR